jgi:uncharacterized membrane protein required for colicin V production
MIGHIIGFILGFLVIVLIGGFIFVSHQYALTAMEEDEYYDEDYDDEEEDEE